jgi:glycerol-3-phosphate dehydrogenase
VPDPAWCVRHEFCHSLEDYLRRRTNIALWTARGGLGQTGENLPAIRRIAGKIHAGDPGAAEAAVAQYEASIRTGFDSVLAAA